MNKENILWRKPTTEDHRLVLRNIKKIAILNCALLGFGILFCIFIDVVGTWNYLGEGYAIPLIVIMQVLILGTITLLLFLMKNFILRFIYVISKKYDVADCIVINKRREPRYRTVHHYVTVGFGGAWQEELFTDAKIFYDVQVGSNELVIRYLVKKQHGRGIQDDLIIHDKLT